jgi:hypothetical protein
MEVNKMKWTRKTKEFEYADYVSGKYHIRDMAMHQKLNGINWWEENGKRGYWWALIIVEDETETLVKAHFKTAKSAKAFAEEIEESEQASIVLAPRIGGNYEYKGSERKSRIQ